MGGLESPDRGILRTVGLARSRATGFAQGIGELSLGLRELGFQPDLAGRQRPTHDVRCSSDARLECRALGREALSIPRRGSQLRGDAAGGHPELSEPAHRGLEREPAFGLGRAASVEARREGCDR